jgi:hypothetical protein
MDQAEKIILEPDTPPILDPHLFLPGFASHSKFEWLAAYTQK